MRVVYKSVCAIVLLHSRPLTSSSMQYVPDVSFRTGSRAGGEWCQSVTDQQLWMWGLKKKKKLADLEGRDRWNAEPTAPFLLPPSESRTGSERGGNVADSWDPRKLVIIWVLCAHLQRLNSWCDEVTYHPNLSAFLWVSWKKARPRAGLIDVLDHCQLHRQEVIS